jgi:hypothetical protein
VLEPAGTSEKVDEVRSVGSIGAQAVVLVLTFPSFTVVVVRMGISILLRSHRRSVLRATRIYTVINHRVGFRKALENDNSVSEKPSSETVARVSVGADLPPYKSTNRVKRPCFAVEN